MEEKVQSLVKHFIYFIVNKKKNVTRQSSQTGSGILQALYMAKNTHGISVLPPVCKE